VVAFGTSDWLAPSIDSAVDHHRLMRCEIDCGRRHHGAIDERDCGPCHLVVENQHAPDQERQPVEAKPDAGDARCARAPSAPAAIAVVAPRRAIRRAVTVEILWDSEVRIVFRLLRDRAGLPLQCHGNRAVQGADTGGTARM